MSTSTRPRNALYAQSGGVTPVINASAWGVIDAVRQHPERIGSLFLARNGILGALNEALIDAATLTDAQLASLKTTPAGAFGSCRHKLKKDAEFDRLVALFEAHDIGYFFYNGGGDSADTCLKVAELARSRGLDLTAVHVPKTIDNDLPLTDCSPGFGSVAKYIATSVREAGLDIASMAPTSTKVFIMEVMGRHAGWTAAAAGLAAANADTPPHLILVPEIAFDEARFIAAVSQTVERVGYCVVVASEGIRDGEGRFLAESGATDAFGHAQLGGVAPVLANLVKAKLGAKVHWAVPDYLQRASRHIASATDLEQAIAVGQAAVGFALEGKRSVMAAIVRDQATPYRWHIAAVPLADVANREKTLPRDYLDAEGYRLTEAGREYFAPLIRGEAFPPFVDGMPALPDWRFDNVTKRLVPFKD
ncbi:6-phosphofructokinase [Jeongeupia chitinilytica]|uniref:Pyrophosphate--fructose 6-phosphate 1-phosphotransferase n=1 Tax=Jeongeupia chitinilytica TaxID=1041641 RepID=A0ABQ3GVN8_9NEIS|nr:6-phosphofructokinase [Jeongeupia chitinilytica]GHD56575.1 pyrophosphate--fructose 6-phosphate 1-phosphotransferase [Jeongeupia chitinilytica]